MFRSLAKIIHRQYFRYTVMTGIYMLGTFETAVLHFIVFVALLLFLNYARICVLFVTEFAQAMKTLPQATTT
jgi:hypothetical protein